MELDDHDLVRHRYFRNGVEIPGVVISHAARKDHAAYEALKAEERRRRMEVGGCCRPEEPGD